jgi:soluble P-type ATPase
LGVPLNYTSASQATLLNFAGTGDLIRRTWHSLENVLAGGVNVAIANGDRDYRCNCMAHFPNPPMCEMSFIFFS